MMDAVCRAVGFFCFGAEDDIFCQMFFDNFH